jgi:uncharacterized protein (UPF0335 family)
MNIDKKALKGIVDEIEASRLRQKAETDHQREVMKRCKPHQLDSKAVRIVLQRRAMGTTRRDEQDYYVHSYEVALGGKKAAMEALENGATVREAAAAGGISTGAAGNLAKAVQKSPFVDTETPDLDTPAGGNQRTAEVTTAQPEIAAVQVPAGDVASNAGGSHEPGLTPEPEVARCASPATAPATDPIWDELAQVKRDLDEAFRRVPA